MALYNSPGRTPFGRESFTSLVVAAAFRCLMSFCQSCADALHKNALGPRTERTREWSRAKGEREATWLSDTALSFAFSGFVTPPSIHPSIHGLRGFSGKCQHQHQVGMSRKKDNTFGDMRSTCHMYIYSFQLSMRFVKGVQ